MTDVNDTKRDAAVQEVRDKFALAVVLTPTQWNLFRALSELTWQQGFTAGIARMGELTEQIFKKATPP
jgi:hypothetical protein